MSDPRPQAGRRADFPHFHPIQTRWMDNDVYGHVNNVVYYSWFDTAVNHYLVRGACWISSRGSDRIGHRNALQLFRLRRLSGADRGRRAGGASGAAACATNWGSSRPARRRRRRRAISHVYVDRAAGPVALPDALRAALAATC
jgi:acyl-CoA thioester hydrolase